LELNSRKRILVGTHFSIGFSWEPSFAESSGMVLNWSHLYGQNSLRNFIMIHIKEIVVLSFLYYGVHLPIIAKVSSFNQAFIGREQKFPIATVQ